jgi:hypothetical protein
VALALVIAGASPAPALAGNGGAFGSERPALRSVTCVSACAGIATARPGSVIRLRGERLGQVAYVAFLGGPGRRDNVVVPTTGVTPSSVDASVPPNALTGRVRAINRDGNRSLASRRLLRITTPTGAAKGIGPLEARGGAPPGGEHRGRPSTPAGSSTTGVAALH